MRALELAHHHRAGARGRGPVHEPDRVAVDVLAHAACDLRARPRSRGADLRPRGRAPRDGSYRIGIGRGATSIGPGERDDGPAGASATSPSGLELRTSTSDVAEARRAAGGSDRDLPAPGASACAHPHLQVDVDRHAGAAGPGHDRGSATPTGSGRADGRVRGVRRRCTRTPTSATPGQIAPMRSTATSPQSRTMSQPAPVERAMK